MESKRGKFWALRVGLEAKEGGLVIRTLPQVMAVDIDAGNGLVHQRRVNGVCLSSKHRLDVAALVLECIRKNLTWRYHIECTSSTSVIHTEGVYPC